MMTHVVRRLFWMVPVLWAAATLIWVFMFLIPGDPARMLSGQRADPEVLRLVRAEWGLDQPVMVRYARFLGKLARLDLGTSYVRQGLPVSGIIGVAMARTLFLAVAAAVLAMIGGIAFGALAVARRSTWLDGLFRVVTTAAISLPTFWLGMMLMRVFAVWLDWFPISSYGESFSLLGIGFPGPLNLVLPAVTLAAGSGGYIARVARASLIEESSQDYVRAGEARGLTHRAALLRHGLANTLLPIITLVGLHFGALLGGAVATEAIFNWPGLGSVMLTALKSRDLPVVEGGAIAMTAAFMLVNMAVDLSYPLLDPRLRD